MDYRTSSSSSFTDRGRRGWTIPAQAAHWLDAGAESIESGRLQPALDRVRSVADYLHRLRRRLVIGLLVAASLVLGWHVFYAPNGMMVYRHKRETAHQLQADISNLQLQNAAYARRVQALKNDPHTIESEARKQLHKVRPGEFVYVSPQALPNVAQPAPPASATARKE